MKYDRLRVLLNQARREAVVLGPGVLLLATEDDPSPVYVSTSTIATAHDLGTHGELLQLAVQAARTRGMDLFQVAAVAVGTPDGMVLCGVAAPPRSVRAA